MQTKRDTLAPELGKFLDKLNYQPAKHLEGQTLEVKGWCKSQKELADKVAEAAVCLTNADGGMLVIGISDSEPAPYCFMPCAYGLPSPDWLEERVKNLTTPPVECRAFWARDLLPVLTEERERSLLVIGISKTSSVTLHRFRGVCYKRKHDACPIEYSTSADDYSSMVLPDTGPNDIDPLSLQRVLSTHPDLSRHGIGDLEFLRKTGILKQQSHEEDDKDNLTIAGLLLLGKPATIDKKIPHAQVAISRLRHSGLAKNVTTEMMNIIQAVLHYSQELENEVPLDQETIHEVLVNALIHRDYRIRGITEITISTDEIVFQNPGSLLAGLTPNNLIRAHPIYRNSQLAEAARQLNLCRKFGEGLDRVYYNCLSEGFDFPLIKTDSDSFKIVFSAKEETGFAKFIKSRSATLANLDRIIVIKTLHAKQHANLDELSFALQRSPGETERILKDMRKSNIIESDNSAWALTSVVESDLRSFEADSNQLGFWPEGIQ